MSSDMTSRVFFINFLIVCRPTHVGINHTNFRDERPRLSCGTWKATNIFLFTTRISVCPFLIYLHTLSGLSPRQLIADTVWRGINMIINVRAGVHFVFIVCNGTCWGLYGLNIFIWLKDEYRNQVCMYLSNFNFLEDEESLRACSPKTDFSWIIVMFKISLR